MADLQKGFQIEDPPILYGKGSEISYADGFGFGDLGADEPVVVVPTPVVSTPFKQLMNFFKTPFGWAFIAASLYFAHREGYIEKLLGKEGSSDQEE